MYVHPKHNISKIKLNFFNFAIASHQVLCIYLFFQTILFVLWNHKYLCSFHFYYYVHLSTWLILYILPITWTILYFLSSDELLFITNQLLDYWISLSHFAVIS